MANWPLPIIYFQETDNCFNPPSTLLPNIYLGLQEISDEANFDIRILYTLYIPDLRGHGKSPAGLEGFKFKDAAKDILALMDHLRIDQAKAIGVSYGGFTLLQMATLAPERISSMVIVGATHYFREEFRIFASGWVRR